VITDVAKLVHRGQPTQNDPVPEMNMAPERAAIRQDDIVTDDGIMAHVGIRHEETIAPDNRSTGFGGRPVQGHKFPDHTPVAHFQRCRFSLEFQILRKTADGRQGMDPAFFPDSAAAVDNRVRTNRRPFTDCDIVLNDSVWSNLHSVADRGFGAHNRVVINV